MIKAPPPQPPPPPPTPEEPKPVEEKIVARLKPKSAPKQEEPQKEELPPPTFAMNNRSFAKEGGQGSSWNLDAAQGDSLIGVVRSRSEPLPEKTGLGGEKKQAVTDFTPSATRDLSRKPEVTRQIVVPYPEEARRQQIQGTVILNVEVRRDGTVRDVQILGDPGSGLGEAARKALFKFTFAPARDKKGRPVDYRLVYKYRFVLDY